MSVLPVPLFSPAIILLRLLLLASILLVLLLSLFAPRYIFSINTASFNPPVEVLVVGAGWAGVVAAHTLATQGGGRFHVTLLEARDRVGGRSWSKKGRLKNGQLVGPVEMGSEWIEMPIGNPLYSLAQHYNLDTYNFSFNPDVFFYPNGSMWPRVDGLRSKKVFSDMLNETQVYARGLTADISLDQAFQEVDSELYRTPEFQFWCAQELEDTYGGDISMLSAKHTGEDREYRGGFLLVPEGFNRMQVHLVDEMMATGHVTLHLETVVTEIEYSPMEDPPSDNTLEGIDPMRVGATTEDGEVFAGHLLVSTLPVGVLKHGDVIFNPPLLSSKLDLLDKIGMWHVNKVHLFFDQVYWKDYQDLDYIGAIDANQRGRYPAFVNMWARYGIAGLQAVAVGMFGSIMSTWTDEETVADAMKKLRSFIPELEDVEPVDAWIARWDVDPYSRGSYSFCKVNCSAHNQDFKDFGEPIWPLLFAGEATSSTFGSTTGAYLSGEREAQRIMNKTHSWVPPFLSKLRKYGF